MTRKTAPYRVGENIVSLEREPHAGTIVHRLVMRDWMASMTGQSFGPLHHLGGEPVGRRLRTVPNVLRLRASP